LDKDPIRKIIHIDMDAFYASVEQMDNPELKGKAVAVGGLGERGVVAAASYEARAYGVRSAMPGVLAKKKCPNLIFVRPRFERYKELSLKIRNIFYEYTDLLEPLSLDEAYLDVTENKKNIESASKLAKEIRQRVKTEIGLNASAGISINKFTAKIASDINKPNGQKTIMPEYVIGFLEKLSIEKFFGVGKVTTEKMNSLGIFNGKDLKAQSLSFLYRNFGKMGKHYYDIVRGIHHSQVKPDRIRKSIAAERTFQKDLNQQNEMSEKLREIAQELEKRMIRAKVKGKTFSLKVKHNDFQIISRSKTLENYFNDFESLLKLSNELLKSAPLKKPVRLLGISVSKLDNNESSMGKQLKLDFPDYKF
jgi:DNA polymerase-4